MCEICTKKIERRQWQRANQDVATVLDPPLNLAVESNFPYKNLRLIISLRSNFPVKKALIPKVSRVKYF